MTIKLSICIPTYNRAQFLTTTLESVISQANDEVEIVISDNASTDSTKSLIDKFRKRFSRITYFRQSENIGFDRNILKAVELAKGHYCWLLGSDDALAIGSIENVFSVLNNSDIYLTDLKKMTLNMDHILESHHRILNSPAGTIFDCSINGAAIKLAYSAKHTGAFFGYISTILFRRSIWQAQSVINDHIGSGWIHVSQCLQMVHAGARVQYIDLPLVLNRTGNDSLLATTGYTRRRLVDLDLPRVARAVFADQPVVLLAITQLVAREYFNLKTLLSDKRAAFVADGPDGTRRLAAIYAQEFSALPRYRLKMLLWYTLPVALLGTLRSILKRYKNTTSAVARSLL